MTENPYETLTAPITPRRTPRRSTPVGFILVLVAMLPTAGIACFTICVGVTQNFPLDRTVGTPANPLSEFTFGSMVGAIVGAVVVLFMLWWAIALNQASKEQPRTWTHMDGDKLVATLVWWDEKEVLLRKRDGKEVKVPIDRLCEADREWMKERG